MVAIPPPRENVILRNQPDGVQAYDVNGNTVGMPLETDPIAVGCDVFGVAVQWVRANHRNWKDVQGIDHTDDDELIITFKPSGEQV